jgi:hypothetical protein
MSRTRLAAVVVEAYNYCSERDSVVVDVLYAPAAFAKPPTHEPPVAVSEAAAPEIAGWWSDPGTPAAVIVGLGYEVGKAVGALEYFEPGAAWAFVPSGDDSRYDQEVDKANRTLWSFVPKPGRLPYKVMRPFECLQALESLTNGLTATYRPILVPFGPKIFAVCAVLVGLQHQPDVAVWRISSGELEKPIDRSAAGRVTGLRISSSV